MAPPPVRSALLSPGWFATVGKACSALPQVDVEPDLVSRCGAELQMHQIARLAVLVHVEPMLELCHRRARVSPLPPSPGVFVLLENLQAVWKPWLKRQKAYQAALAKQRPALQDGSASGPAPQAPARPAPLYGQVCYRARSWRVVIKVDRELFAGREPKLNQRFVLTDMGGSAQRIYERLYCPRRAAEYRLKELQQGLAMDRTSCQRFAANQFRVLLAAAADTLLQELRRQAAGTEYERAQVERLRLHLLKLAARVEQTARAVVLHLPAAAPAMGAWLVIAARLGAATPPT